MRYRFVDEILSLALDGIPRIEVAKSFGPGDDVFSGPQGPERVPESMLLELMAMTGGHLVFRHLGEGRLPLLLKVPDCRFEASASAGERLRAVAVLSGVSSMGDGTSVVETETRIYLETRQIAIARIRGDARGDPASPGPSSAQAAKAIQPAHAARDARCRARDGRRRARAGGRRSLALRCPAR